MRLAEKQTYRRVPTPLRSISPLSGGDHAYGQAPYLWIWKTHAVGLPLPVVSVAARDSGLGMAFAMRGADIGEHLHTQFGDSKDTVGGHCSDIPRF